jgi:hypothetical protein
VFMNLKQIAIVLSNTTTFYLFRHDCMFQSERPKRVVMPEYKNVVVSDGTIAICFYIVNFHVYVFLFQFLMLTRVMRTRKDMQESLY